MLLQLLMVYEINVIDKQRVLQDIFIIHLFPHTTVGERITMDYGWVLQLQKMHQRRVVV
jgi:hypothetical protein